MTTNLPVQHPGAKPPAKADAAPGPRLSLAPADKAAIVLAALGPEAAPSVLRGMGEGAIRRFAQAMSNLWKVSPEELDQVISDFIGELGGKGDVKVGSAEARRILSEMLDNDSVSRIMDDVDASGTRSLWEKLSANSDQALAGFLKHEHPQTAAVVLSKMRAEKAARILEKLDPEFAQIIVLRLARVPRLDSEVMDILKEVVNRDVIAVMRREQATRRPADVIGSMLQNVSSRNRAALLEQLEEEKPAIARQVQRVLFTFSDIPSRVDSKDIQAIIKAVEEMLLISALKFAEQNAPKVPNYFLLNMSKRLSQRLADEIAQFPIPAPRDGEAAQQEVVNAIRELAGAGEIRLLDDEEEEEE